MSTVTTVKVTAVFAMVGVFLLFGAFLLSGSMASAQTPTRQSRRRRSRRRTDRAVSAATARRMRVTARRPADRECASVAVAACAAESLARRQ